MERKSPFIIGFSLLTGASLLLGFLPNDAWWLSLKVVVLLVAVFTLYKLSGGLPASEVDEESEESGAISEKDGFLPEPSQSFHINLEDDVETHFEQFLKTLFPVIKDTTVAQTVVLLMINFSKKKFYIRHKLTDAPDDFCHDAFLELAGGMPGLVLKKKESIIEGTLPDNEQLLPYYQTDNLPAKSFIGAPIFFDNHLIGVLCCDAKPEQAFGEADLALLEEYARLVSIQLVGSNKLYEYEAENWNTRLLYEFSRGILGLNSSEQIWSYLVEQITAVFHPERFVVSARKDESSAEVVFLSGAANGIKVGQVFAVDEGLIGWVFRKNQSMLVQDFSSKKNYIPRIALNETQVPEYKSLLAVAVCRENKSEYVISLESSKKEAFTEQHKKILETMAYQISSFLEKAAILEALDQQNLFDHDTEVGNRRALLRALDQELSRAGEFDKSFCLQAIKIRSDRKLEPEIYSQVAKEFVSFVLPLLAPINYIFRLEEKVFVILWPERSLQESLPRMEAFLEALRNRKPWANGLVESLHVFTSVVEYPMETENSEQLLEKLVEALRLAEIKDTNEIEIYGDKTALKPQGE